jgi:DNA-binding NarL/FixJ family response regulator
LTERELEILDLIAQGHNNMIISNKLSLSIKTVPNYVSSILTKLQVVDRSQAIVRAREAGLGQSNSNSGASPR